MANKIGSMRFRQTYLNHKNEIRFDFDLLKLYLAVDEKKTVSSLFKEVQLDPPIFKNCLVKLIKLKLIEPVNPPKNRFVNGAFLNRLRGVLVSVSGPLGGILIEEVATEMRIDASRIPTPKLSDFVNQIADRIPGERQAEKFKQIMLAEIQGQVSGLPSSVKGVERNLDS